MIIIKRCKMIVNRMIIAVMFVVILSCGTESQDAENGKLTDYQLVTISCNGQVSLYGKNYVKKNVFLIKKYGIPLIGAGIKYNNRFYVLQNRKILEICINTFKMREVFRFDSLKHPEIYPVKLINIDQTYYYLYAISRKYEMGNANKMTYYIYRISKETHRLDPINVPFGPDDKVAMYGKRIYYTRARDGEICFIDENIEHNTGINGEVVSVSPDGEKLVFFRYGLVNGIFIYNCSAGREIAIAKYITGDYYPHVQWSQDSKVIAFSERSDIFSDDVLIASVDSGHVLQVIKKSHACDWFFSSIKKRSSE